MSRRSLARLVPNRLLVVAVCLRSLCGAPESRAAVDDVTSGQAGGHQFGLGARFFDCTGEGAPSEHGIRKAFRRSALEHHPDKGGKDDDAAGLADLRDSWIREPLRFHIFRAMFDPTGGAGPAEGSVIEGVGVRVLERDGWPYVELRVDIAHDGRLEEGGLWTFAFGLRSVSTVHYRGDEAAGGYDACCDFAADSRCRRKPRVQEEHGNSSSNSNATNSQYPNKSDVGAQGSRASEDLYDVSDCPLPSRFVASIRKPLHLNETGQWAAALQLSDIDGDELACLSIPFYYDGLQIGIGVEAPDSSEDGGEAPPDDRGSCNAEDGDGCTPPEAAGEKAAREPSSSPRGAADEVGGWTAFKHFGTGSYCEDGADILEGPVDDYGGLSPFGGAKRADAESSLFYGSRCKAKCAQRRRCLFYTAYSSGWCQLSSQCSRLKRTGDPLTITFEKTAAAV